MEKNVLLIAFVFLSLTASTAVAAPDVRVVVVPLGGAKNYMYWQGEWAVDTSYKIGDGVQYEGSSYVSVELHESTYSDAPPSLYWNLLAEKGDAGAVGEQGETGPAGNVGVNCWDIDADRSCDLATEDVNGDTFCDVLDCRGAQGNPGEQGDVGSAGTDGSDGDVGPQGPIGITGSVGERGPQGVSGIDGINGEDGLPGETGPAGNDGVNCWDIDASGSCDLAAEDVNGDDVCDVSDCKGEQGDAGTPGDSVPPGYCILGLTSVAPVGYTYTGQEIALDSWLTKRSMPTARWGLSAATINGKVYVIGGYDGSAQVATNEEYDPVTDTWASKADMPALLSGFAAAAVNGKMYVFGGYDYSVSAIVKTNQAYDPVANIWESRAEMPVALQSHAAAAANGKIFTLGGYDGSAYVAATREYDPVADIWTDRADMASVRYIFGVAVVNEKIYAIGGYDPATNMHVAANEEYDPVGDTWAGKTDMPTARQQPQGATINDKIYVFGGNDRSGGTSSILVTNEECDPATDSWQSMSEMPYQRHVFAAASGNGKIYLIGGAYYDGTQNNPLSRNEEFFKKPTYYLHAKD